MTSQIEAAHDSVGTAIGQAKLFQVQVTKATDEHEIAEELHTLGDMLAMEDQNRSNHVHALHVADLRVHLGIGGEGAEECGQVSIRMESGDVGLGAR